MQTGSTPVLDIRGFCLQHHSLIDHLQRDIDGMNLICHQSHLQRNHARADGNLQHSTPISKIAGDFYRGETGTSSSDSL
jgi:hypothetical protein